MKMKEICARSELTERAVRLYCERGLVHPEKRWERGREYLEFSDHNLRELTIVAQLRRAEFTLDEIALMLEDPARCGDVLAGWRGRVTEQNQRLESAKDKLAELSAHDSFSAERLAELLGARTAAHGAAPYEGETFAEFCERTPTESDYSPEMLELSRREEKRAYRGRLFMILYSVVMGFVSLIYCGLLYTQSQSLLPGLIQLAMFIFLTVFLFRGTVWARVIAVIRHGFSAITAAMFMPEYFPGTKVFVENTLSSDGTVTPIYQTISLDVALFVTGILGAAVLLDLFCVYMLWFNRGVKEYLYDRSLNY
jgi:DNA-binding transcriptional MerR regulator